MVIMHLAPNKFQRLQYHNVARKRRLELAALAALMRIQADAKLTELAREADARNERALANA